MNTTLSVAFFSLLTGSLALAAKKNQDPIYTDPAIAAKNDPDFMIQGEYGIDKEGEDLGVQVVAGGNGQFDAYLLEGGLPGLGWTREKKREKITGKREGNKVVFSGEPTAVIENGKISIKRKQAQPVTLPRIERKSSTLGSKPPEGATVLFDGTSTDKWKKATMKDDLLQASKCTTKEKFGDYTLHLEFRTPFKPFARDQARGNSGLYIGGRWENQILDSFGLTGEMNECGGIYTVAKSLVNACFPPLAWQTYDINFTNAKFDGDGKQTAWPRITSRLNGILIHDDQELDKEGTTAAPITGPLTPEGGPIYLQYHGNPVVFRNIWILPTP